MQKLIPVPFFGFHWTSPTLNLRGLISGIGSDKIDIDGIYKNGRRVPVCFARASARNWRVDPVHRSARRASAKCFSQTRKRFCQIYSLGCTVPVGIIKSDRSMVLMAAVDFFAYRWRPQRVETSHG
jgi:hypothetical protein